jgi:hypothetical protein
MEKASTRNLHVLSVFKRLCSHLILGVDVGRALAIGRSFALQSSGTNRPVGSRYNAAMGSWLRENDLDGISAQERYRALLVLENLVSITAWRETLDEAHRRRLNHPNAIWAHWRCSTTAEPQHTVRQAAKAKRGYGRPICFPQNMEQRAAIAIRKANSNDILVLARVSLENAIRFESDLLELLQAETPAKPPQRPAAGLHASVWYEGGRHSKQGQSLKAAGMPKGKSPAMTPG